MPEIRFYHLARTPLEQALPQLLEKVLERGGTAEVVVGSGAEIKSLDQAIWAYKATSFIPHSCDISASPRGQDSKVERARASEEAPVSLVLENGFKDRRPFVFFVSAAQPRVLSAEQTGIFLFDGLEQIAVQKARQTWKKLRQEEGNTLTYWQQNEKGQWREKARSEEARPSMVQTD